LMQKLETINKTEILTESEKKETTWTDKSGKKHPATQVKGDKYTGKEADKEDKKSKKDDLEENFNSAIARSLVEEFGYDLDERITINPDGTTSGGIAPAPAASPWANDPAKDAAWKALTPQDQKWLGGADPTDTAILARAPNKGKPAAPAAAPAVSNSQNPGGMSDEEMLARQQQPAATTAAPPAGGAGGDAAVAKTRERMTALLDKLEKTGGVSGSPAAAPTAAKPATGAATKPAAAPAPATSTPAAAPDAAAPSGAQAAGQSVGGAIKSGAKAVGDFAKGAYQGLTKESVNYQDDQILLAIKNIQY
jgi:hypothetical protein